MFAVQEANSITKIAFCTNANRHIRKPQVRINSSKILVDRVLHLWSSKWPQACNISVVTITFGTRGPPRAQVEPEAAARRASSSADSHHTYQPAQWGGWTMWIVLSQGHAELWCAGGVATFIYYTITTFAEESRDRRNGRVCKLGSTLHQEANQETGDCTD